MKYSGYKVSEPRLEATGILNSLPTQGLVGIAEDLRDLTDEQFELALEGFRLYRQAIALEERRGE